MNCYKWAFTLKYLKETTFTLERQTENRSLAGGWWVTRVLEGTHQDSRATERLVKIRTSKAQCWARSKRFTNLSYYFWLSTYCVPGTIWSTHVKYLVLSTAPWGSERSLLFLLPLAGQWRKQDLGEDTKCPKGHSHNHGQALGNPGREGTSLRAFAGELGVRCLCA